MLLWPWTLGLLRRAGPRWQTYAFTFFTEFVAVAALFVSLKLAASLLGPEGFGQYAVVRRVFALLAPTLTVALRLSLPRAVTRLAAGPAGADTRGAYLVAGLLIALPPLALFGLLAGVFRHEAAAIFFGSSTQAGLIVPVSLTVAGLGVHYVLYGYLRGYHLIAANALQLANLVLVPPLALLLSSSDAARAIALTGLGWLAVTGTAGLWVRHIDRIGRREAGLVSPAARELLLYGAPRLPAELAQPGLFSLPTILVAQAAGVQAAGYFSFGLSLLQVIGSIFAPAGLLLWPEIARLVTTGTWDRISLIVGRLLLGGVALVIPLIALSEVLLEPLVVLFLGPEFVAATAEVRWLLLGALPYTMYILLRGPLDVIDRWPHNSVHLMAALALAVGLLAFGSVRVAPQLAMLAAFTLLGCLTYLAWRRRLAGRNGGLSVGSAEASSGPVAGR